MNIRTRQPRLRRLFRRLERRNSTKNILAIVSLVWMKSFGLD